MYVLYLLLSFGLSNGSPLPDINPLALLADAVFCLLPLLFFRRIRNPNFYVFSMAWALVVLAAAYAGWHERPQGLSALSLEIEGLPRVIEKKPMVNVTARLSYPAAAPGPLDLTPRTMVYEYAWRAQADFWRDSMHVVLSKRPPLPTVFSPGESLSTRLALATPRHSGRYDLVVTLTGFQRTGTRTMIAKRKVSDILVMGMAPQATEPGETPFGALDHPPAGSTLKGMVDIQGWALGDSPVARVEIWIDGALAAEAEGKIPREDVFKAFPAYREHRAGFRWTWNTLEAADGAHEITGIAYDERGGFGEIGRAGVTILNERGPNAGK